MLAVIFFGFVFSFYLTFGQELQGFSSITKSAASLISGISGNIDTDELMAVAGVPRIVSYLCLFILVLLTMFLAVINQGRRVACSLPAASLPNLAASMLSTCSWQLRLLCT
jgi:hypothetical protein